MDFFKFNKIYVIESLTNERPTGTELYNDIIKRLMPNSELLQVHSLSEWNNAVAKIKDEVSNMNVIPVLHLELHGDLKGLVLSNGDIITWADFVDRMREINVKTENNLFITMGICFGANILLHTQFDKPAPFFGFIGSLHEIYNGDIYLRYSEFYYEFLKSYDITQSLERLYKANPEHPNVYSFVNAPELFRTVYKEYLTTQFTEDAQAKRSQQAIDSITSLSPEDRTQLEVIFKENLEKYKEKYYIEHITGFLMTDRFESCRKRFSIPQNIEDFISGTNKDITPNIIT